MIQPTLQVKNKDHFCLLFGGLKQKQKLGTKGGELLGRNRDNLSGSDDVLKRVAELGI